ncbi:hypothetical protein [Natranaeroarchaeum sulfidigenes]|uniref:Uncharacterized protein n=1 Tax=Natranaeroarchaeum sulfidigenes TaxID=2784880 RepID=A0A897MVV8_9EURY|nr:hypothetical protein [Natranaeroarchaeum sulfidigenes]QSG02296.1 Uncharacterized protein AArcS_1075 [Natranaeroarchaeum sulfidigenes]
MTTTLSPKSLARTYDVRNRADGWDAVEDYQRYLEVAAQHPDSGSSALSSKLEMPRGRIRSWENGSKPDPARAVEVAEERDWFGGPDTDEFAALNQLVAWIFSGGSINERDHSPYFALGRDGDAERVTDALDQLGLDWRRERDDQPDRATEIVPTEHASILGRALSVLGAPVGDKNDRAEISLPEYLDDAPDEIRADFVDVYLRNRAQSHDDKGTLTLREERADRYLQELAALIEDVAGESVTVSDKNVIVSAAAANALYGKIDRPF